MIYFVTLFSLCELSQKCSKGFHYFPDSDSCQIQCPLNTKLFSANNSCLTCMGVIYMQVCKQKCPLSTIQFKDFCLPSHCTLYSFIKGRCVNQCEESQYINYQAGVFYCSNQCQHQRVQNKTKKFCRKQCSNQLRFPQLMCNNSVSQLQINLIGICIGLTLLGIFSYVFYCAKTRLRVFLTEQVVQTKNVPSQFITVKVIQSSDSFFYQCVVCLQESDQRLYRCHGCNQTNHEVCLRKCIKNKLTKCPYCKQKLIL